MKISEVEFKCVLPDLDTAKRIAKLAWLSPAIHYYPFLIVKDQSKPENGDIRTAWTSLPKLFIEAKQPYMAPDEAIKLLESCEENQKPAAAGEWIEFDLDQVTGGFTTLNDYTWCWQNHVACEIREGLIFGGWKFPGASCWTQNRIGMDKAGTITPYASEWEKPLIPGKIRFWRPNK